MIFIDWISTPDHASFNRSLFEALDFPRSHLYAFSEKLFLDGQDNQLLPGGNRSRFRQAWEVIRTCWVHRSERIFLLSYDQMFLPLITLFCSRLFVYEHNTTPETLDSKHAFWQKCFFRSITRFAQYPSQEKILSQLKQRVVYLGSPLGPSEPISFTSNPDLFLAPSWRLSPNEVVRLAPGLRGHKVVVKKGALTQDDIGLLASKMNIEVVDYINLEELLPRTLAIIVSVSSGTRGTGWFNEAIKHGVPLIITDLGAQALFQGTFPHYPFLHEHDLCSPSTFAKRKDELLRFSHQEYIENHNARMKLRFESIG